MALLTRFDTPGSLRDAPDGSPFYDAWHDVVDALVATRTHLSGPGAYVDPTDQGLRVTASRTSTWTGFPRPLLMTHRDDRAAAFAAGEDRNQQIEYLEWHVVREEGTITSVTFVCETPEYWRTLAASHPDLVLERYRELVDPAVERDDLFPDGRTYDPLNRWNTTDGIVHYVMRINSMKDLLGVSQEPEPTDRALDAYDALPYSRATGADARIDMDVWAITRAGLSVTTADPPGLYMADWDDTGWTAPDGRPVADHWQVVRGVPGAALRLRYEVPDGAGYRVGDIRIGGRPITSGGQIAEHIVMSATVVAGTDAP